MQKFHTVFKKIRKKSKFLKPIFRVTRISHSRNFDVTSMLVLPVDAESLHKIAIHNFEESHKIEIHVLPYGRQPR